MILPGKTEKIGSLLVPRTAPQTFVACLAAADIPDGLPAGLLLWETPEQATAACKEGRLWVVAVPPGGAVFEGQSWHLQQPLPASAVCNRSPYRPPVTVPAAGGVVIRGTVPAIEVLLIHRRGHWDLPKGKCDPGELLEHCALREVSEELGIASKALCLRMPLGRTVHAYPLNGHYAVKPIRWFLMETAATAFTPQETEDIQEICWFPLGEALRRVTYPSLQALLEHLEVLAKLGLL